MDVDIDDVALIGVIKDVPPYELPPEAWSLGENVRMVDGAVTRLKGKQPIFGTPLAAPYFLLYVAAGAQSYWIYTSLTRAYVFDGNAHSDITRVTSGYNANGAQDLNGTVFGGIPIVNNGNDIPQYWPTNNPTTRMDNMTNWPTTLRARVIRTFGSFLMALNVTDNGTNFPHRIRWSSSADPGTLPATWDVADETKDAGEKDLTDVDSGIVLDGGVLGKSFFSYKGSSTWVHRLIGGRFAFSHDIYLATSGILATRCWALTGKGDQHFVVTQDDVILHDGTGAPVPVLSKKMRRYLFNQIDVNAYQTSFVFANPAYKEMWFCYPSQGAVRPNRALIFNLETGAPTEGDIDFVCAAIGDPAEDSGTPWNQLTNTWDEATQTWNLVRRRRVLVGRPQTEGASLWGSAIWGSSLWSRESKILLLDEGDTDDGVSFTGRVQRTGLSIVGRKRNGEWIEDHAQKKQHRRTWLRMSGGPVSIRIASQKVVEGAVTWSAPVAFDPETDLWIDKHVSGRALGIEISGNVPWTLHGYKFDQALLGRFG